MAPKERQVRNSACPHDCPSTCALEIDVLDAHTIGRVRGAEQNDYTAGVICAKVARYAERIHNPNRLVHPLRRKGPVNQGLFRSPEPATMAVGQRERQHAEPVAARTDRQMQVGPPVPPFLPVRLLGTESPALRAVVHRHRHQRVRQHRHRLEHAEAVVGQPTEVRADGLQGPTVQRRGLGGSACLRACLLRRPLAESLEQLLLAVKGSPGGSRRADGRTDRVALRAGSSRASGRRYPAVEA